MYLIVGLVCHIRLIHTRPGRIERGTQCLAAPARVHLDALHYTPSLKKYKPEPYFQVCSTSVGASELWRLNTRFTDKVLSRVSYNTEYLSAFMRCLSLAKLVENG
jgi:hypothetical protein